MLQVQNIAIDSIVQIDGSSSHLRGRSLSHVLVLLTYTVSLDLDLDLDADTHKSNAFSTLEEYVNRGTFLTTLKQLNTNFTAASIVLADQEKIHLVVVPSPTPALSPSPSFFSSSPSSPSSVSKAYTPPAVILLVLWYVAIVATVLGIAVLAKHLVNKYKATPSSVLSKWIHAIHLEKQEMASKESTPLLRPTCLESTQVTCVRRTISTMELKLTRHLQALSNFSESAKMAQQLTASLKQLQDSAKQIIFLSTDYLRVLSSKNAEKMFTNFIVQEVLPAQLLTLKLVVKWRIRVLDSTGGRFVVPNLPADMLPISEYNAHQHHALETLPGKKSIIQNKEYNLVMTALAGSHTSLVKTAKRIASLNEFHQSGRGYVVGMVRNAHALIAVQMQQLKNSKNNEVSHMQHYVDSQETTGMQLRVMLTTIQDDAIDLVEMISMSSGSNSNSRPGNTNKYLRHSSAVAPLATAGNKESDSISERSNEEQDDTKIQEMVPSENVLKKLSETIVQRLWLRLLLQQKERNETTAARKLQSIWRKQRIQLALGASDAQSARSEEHSLQMMNETNVSELVLPVKTLAKIHSDNNNKPMSGGYNTSGGNTINRKQRDPGDEPIEEESKVRRTKSSYYVTC